MLHWCPNWWHLSLLYIKKIVDTGSIITSTVHTGEWQNARHYQIHLIVFFLPNPIWQVVIIRHAGLLFFCDKVSLSKDYQLSISINYCIIICLATIYFVLYAGAVWLLLLKQFSSILIILAEGLAAGPLSCLLGTLRSCSIQVSEYLYSACELYSMPLVGVCSPKVLVILLSLVILFWTHV